MKNESVLSSEAPAPIGPYSQGIAIGSWLFTSGQIALAPRTGALVAEGDVRGQTRQVLANLMAVLRAGGCTPSDVVKTTIYLVDMSDFAVVNEIYAEFFVDDAPPARSTVQVAALPKGALVEIDAVAHRSSRV